MTIPEREANRRILWPDAVQDGGWSDQCYHAFDRLASPAEAPGRVPRAGLTYAPESLILIRWLHYNPDQHTARIARAQEASPQSVLSRLRVMRRMGLVEYASRGSESGGRLTHWFLTVLGQEFRQMIDFRGVI